MKQIKIPDNRKAFVGVEVGNDKIKFGIVNYYGNLLSAGSSFFPKDTAKLGEHIAYTIKGMRGGANVRMKNFAGIGISFANPDLVSDDIEEQITQNIAVPIYFEDYERVKLVGQDWLEHLGANARIPERADLSDLYVVYGLVNRIKEIRFRGKGLLQDPKASPSKPGQPFFIRNEGEQVYTGFPLIPETETDGFTYGAITNFLELDSEKGCTSGDGYVQAPDGSRAGLIWHVGDSFIEMLDEPDDKRWGVYNIFFPKLIKSLDDLVYNFKEVLPLIKKQYENRLLNYKSKKNEPKKFFCLCCGYKTLDEEPPGTY